MTPSRLTVTAAWSLNTARLALSSSPAVAKVTGPFTPTSPAPIDVIAGAFGLGLTDPLVNGGQSLVAGPGCRGRQARSIGLQSRDHGVDASGTDLRVELVPVVLHVGNSFDADIEGPPASTNPVQ